ncbi:hypothetical protein MFLAVUS_010242 [Mucor flavus]|uniref:Uncharacterized protein n=1 Tax=Mucor flavus TaxID=439312 RepID=A0ABP9ZC52_9FUNG
MTLIDIKELDSVNTRNLLKRLDEWRRGICSDGTLSKEPCFVLEHRPIITIHPDQSQQVVTTELITEREWSDNLVDCGAMTHLNDDILMKTLSDLFMIFHSTDTPNNCNTLHSIQLQKHASFKVDNILRPTRPLQQSLKELFIDDNLKSKWDKLVNIWTTYGYLWPRKIIVGYKTHLKQSYKFIDGRDNTKGYYSTLSKLKEKLRRQPQPQPQNDTFDLDFFLKNATVIARVDLAPIHEFFDLESRTKINTLIHAKFIQIPVYSPIKIYNVLTNSYLCWDPYSNAQQDPSFDGETHDYLVRAVSADPLELNWSPESQYIWRMTWRPTQLIETNDTFDPEEHRPQTIRGCSKVYLYPACKSISPTTTAPTTATRTATAAAKKQTKQVQNSSWRVQDRMIDGSELADTHQMVLSCRPYQYELKSPHHEFSKLRPLRLLSNKQYLNEKIDWTIEYPNNGLKYMTDAQANIKLNFHEHVRRLKPILIGDTIQLQQIGLLTAFNPISKLTDGIEPQPNQSANRRTIAKKTSFKSKNKKNVLCVDEDMIMNNWGDNTFWKIELASKADMSRHSSQFIRWPQSNADQTYGYPKDYRQMLSQEIYTYIDHLPIYLDKDTNSLSSTKTVSLRRSKSLESFNTTIHARDDSEKAPYFSKSKILTQIAKVSLQPLAQLVKPSRSKQQKQQP